MDAVTPAQIGGRLPAFTVVVAVALLLALLGSEVVLLTVVVLERGPLLAVTTIVTVAEAPLFSVPRLQDTVEVPLQLPTLAVADTNETQPATDR